MATISKSWCGASAARRNDRPVRPNPLIASRTVIAALLHFFGDRSISSDLIVER